MTEDVKTAELRGRCLCGAVTITAPSAKLHADLCHCSMCRRWTGGPMFAVSCGTRVDVEGAEAVSAYRSSDWAERAFCRTCGSTLYYRFLPTGDYILSAGLFDDQTRFTLVEEIFVDEKPGWYDFANDTRKKTGAEVIAAHAQGDAI